MKIDVSDSIQGLDWIEPGSLLEILAQMLECATEVQLQPAEHVMVDAPGQQLVIRMNGDHTVETCLNTEVSFGDGIERCIVRQLPALTFHHAQVVAARWVSEKGHITHAWDMMGRCLLSGEQCDPYLHGWTAEPKNAAPS